MLCCSRDGGCLNTMGTLIELERPLVSPVSTRNAFDKFITAKKHPSIPVFLRVKRKNDYWILSLAFIGHF